MALPNTNTKLTAADQVAWDPVSGMNVTYEVTLRDSENTPVSPPVLTQETFVDALTLTGQVESLRGGNIKIVAIKGPQQRRSVKCLIPLIEVDLNPPWRTRAVQNARIQPIPIP